MLPLLLVLVTRLLLLLVVVVLQQLLLPLPGLRKHTPDPVSVALRAAATTAAAPPILRQPQHRLGFEAGRRKPQAQGGRQNAVAARLLAGGRVLGVAAVTAITVQSKLPLLLRPVLFLQLPLHGRRRRRSRRLDAHHGLPLDVAAAGGGGGSAAGDDDGVPVRVEASVGVGSALRVVNDAADVDELVRLVAPEKGVGVRAVRAVGHFAEPVHVELPLEAGELAVPVVDREHLGLEVLVVVDSERFSWRGKRGRKHKRVGGGCG